MVLLYFLDTGLILQMNKGEKKAIVWQTVWNSFLGGIQFGSDM